jgi:hypothetical protein
VAGGWVYRGGRTGVFTEVPPTTIVTAGPRAARRRPVEAPGSPPPDLDARLKRLHLPTVRRLYPELARRAKGEGMTYQTFLEPLIAEEMAHRAETRLRGAVANGQFPYLGAIDDFNPPSGGRFAARCWARTSSPRTRPLAALGPSAA